MQNLWQDLRHSVRLIFRNPGFAALAVPVLALGIGANTAIFTLITNLILRPMPFEKPEHLVGCFSKDTQTPNTFREFSYPNYVDIRDSNGVFTDLTAYTVLKEGLWLTLIGAGLGLTLSLLTVGSSPACSMRSARWIPSFLWRRRSF